MEKLKKLKRIIIILLIIIVIIFILLLSILNNKKQEEEQIKEEIAQMVDTSEEQQELMQFITDKKEYLNISNCLTKFISELNVKKSSYYGRDEKNNYTIVVSEDIINQNICNMLSQEYINENNIDLKNVREFVYKIEEKCFYVPVEVYSISNTENIRSYGIYGVIEDIEYNPITESYLILNVDENNQTFSVEVLDNIEQIKNKEGNNITEIPNKENNIYSDIIGVIDEKLIQEYINSYKRLALGYPEIIYNNYLDNDYKDKKYGTLEQYKEYVKNNKEEIKSINLKEYAILEEENYTQYIGIDQNGKYYIFNVATIFDYKMLLDNYTVDIAYFTRKYENSNSIEKCAYNIQKCIEAINNKDYLYVYNKLDNTFKENNYKTQESFIKVIKDKLYKVNVVDKHTVSNEGNIYIYDLIIKDKNSSDKKIPMKVIMQLKEGTDFVMSFSFK